MQQQEQIKNIFAKIKKLKTLYLSKQTEILALQKELTNVIEQNKNLEQNVNQLEQQVFLLKSSRGELNRDDKKDFEKKINSYIKDIDKCIEILIKK